MHNSSTILTVGTALRHAQDGNVPVHVLVGGMWMTGLVVGVDGEGAVLQTPGGDTTVLRIQAVTAVRVEQVIGAPAEPREEPVDRTAPRPEPGWNVATDLFTRDLVTLHREPQPA